MLASASYLLFINSMKSLALHVVEMPESLTRQFPVSRNRKPIDIASSPAAPPRVFDFHWNFFSADGARVGVKGPTGDFTAFGFV